jgi:choline-glycine betaine transporter
MADDFDNINEFEAHDTGKKLPLGWQLLFWGLIVWGLYYVVSFTPSLGGWSQEKAYTQTVKP